MQSFSDAAQFSQANYSRVLFFGTRFSRGNEGRNGTKR
uniref:Uncharacterized protein n=1 Tax=Arundo donax TaxID=35708 RepID=A0A0A9G192_ARUDO